jgi:hypothetical protein
VYGWQPYHFHVLFGYLEVSTSWNSTLWAFKRPVQGLLYLYLTVIDTITYITVNLPRNQILHTYRFSLLCLVALFKISSS